MDISVVLFYSNPISSGMIQENNWIQAYLILLRFNALHSCVVFYKWRQDPRKKITTHFMAVVWNQSRISEVCHNLKGYGSSGKE